MAERAESHLVKMRKIRFLFLPDDSGASGTGQDSIHPFSFGNIVVETGEGTVTPYHAGNANCPFLLLALTDLLDGLEEFLRSPSSKRYAFTPHQTRFDLVFERRKHAAIALTCQGRRLGVYPESVVYDAFRDALRASASEYLPRFSRTDEYFGAAMKDVCEEFSAAMKRFEELGDSRRIVSRGQQV